MKSHNPKNALNWLKDADADKMNKFSKVISQSIKDINNNLVYFPKKSGKFGLFIKRNLLQICLE